MYFNVQLTVLCLETKSHGEIKQTLSSKMYKHLVQQKGQQKVHNNCVALLIKRSLNTQLKMQTLFFTCLIKPNHKGNSTF